MTQHTLKKMHYNSIAERKHCEDEEEDRMAFKTRINYVFLEETHDGNLDFPYDAVDLALYLQYMVDKDSTI